MPSSQGAVLQGRYELQTLLATGGMGQVWRAQDLVLERQVAVKVLRSEYTGDPVFLTRFRTEARLSAGLTHANIAVLHDYGEVEPAEPGGDRVVYLVMELVEGEPLSGLLAREGRLAPDRTLELLGQVAAGLAAAHAAGVVHRDVKPANLLVRPDGAVKITDFGIAWSAANATVTRTGHVVGTAQYLAPEQVQGLKATPASDVYSWGMVAYECLAGRRAFDGPEPVEVAMRRLREVPDPLPDDVPEPVRRLVERALVRDPADRIPDGAALVAAVGDAAAGRTTVATAATRVLPAVLPQQGDTSPLPVAAVPAATPADEDGDDDADGHEERGRLRRLLVPALVALVATALAATGLVLGSRDAPAPAAPPAAAPTTSATTTTAPPTSAAPRPSVTYVRVDAADLLGRPVAEVQSWLTGLDLVVALRGIQTTDVPAGQVIGVDPTGEVPVGTTVTVTHAVAPPPPPPPTTAPAPSPTPNPEAPAETASGDEEEGQGRGRGRDRGNDDEDD